jgi:hypothetical protein
MRAQNEPDHALSQMHLKLFLIFRLSLSAIASISTRIRDHALYRLIGDYFL